MNDTQQKLVDDHIASIHEYIEDLKKHIDRRRNTLVSHNWLVQFDHDKGCPTWLHIETDENHRIVKAEAAFTPMQASFFTEEDARKVAADARAGKDVVGRPVLYVDALHSEITRSEASIDNFKAYIASLAAPSRSDQEAP